jgi:hypothetical protein
VWYINIYTKPTLIWVCSRKSPFFIVGEDLSKKVDYTLRKAYI